MANILPAQFGKCIQIPNLNKNIDIADNFIEIDKYSCNSPNKIVFIGITDFIPGILKINSTKITKNFIIKHFWIKKHFAGVYIDKNSQTGVLSIKLSKKYAIKFIFYTTNYRDIIHLARELNFKEIKNNLEKKEIKETL
jgi:hypothetical protein